MDHLLNNPAWNALISGNKDLSLGNEKIKYFDPAVSPFAAFNENTVANFHLLYEMLPHNRPVLFVAPGPIEIPVEWKVLSTIRGWQMVHNGDTDITGETLELLPLTAEHVPQMVALAKLTNPGPFESRTIDFGHYCGIFVADKLVAMAGQRMHAANYAEISAVCTHPGYNGKGYARQLLLKQIQRIKAATEIPFLHVRHDNYRAIKVYESLGFYTRTEVYFYYMIKG